MAAKKKSAKKKPASRSPATLRTYSVPVRKPGETRRRVVTVALRATSDADANAFLVGTVVGCPAPDFAYAVAEADDAAFMSAAEFIAEQTASRYGIPGDARFE